ncbi:MAG: hypothetical protein HeimC2_17690 [Candidatus Heimdallarchaeota archaeon LC_2]|nr:MAG: hypothetical protein HeimC2_17690 [Candidatus Heimdallarchaeota archaeon LC_2]
MNELYLQIFHRIAFVIGIIPVLVLLIIPQIFTESKDLEFATKTKSTLMIITKIALLFSFVTGVLRIELPLHPFLIFKILLGIISILSFYFYDLEITHPKYQTTMTIRLILLLTTALIGLSI